MKKPLAAFAFAFGLLAVSFTIARAETCAVKAADIVEGTLSRLPSGSILQVLKGEEAAAFVSAYNALPPASQFEGDEVYLFRIFGGPIVLVNIARAGCLVESGPLPAEIIPELMPARLGGKIKNA